MNERIFNPGKRELAKLYKSFSTIQIAKQYGVNPETVRKRLHAYGIKARSAGGRRSFNVSKRHLDSLYQKHSLREIAAMYEVGQTVIFNRIAEYGIKIRDEDVARSQRKKGIVFSPEHRMRISLAHRGRWVGEKNPNWKGGVHHKHLSLRASGEYKMWKASALERAGYCCQSCGVEQGSVCDCCGTKIVLHVHHVKSFSAHVESRFDPANSEVLCPKCHHVRHH